MKYLLSITAFIAIVTMVNGQDRLKRGAIYQQGEAVYAPMVGYKGVVPTGWFGTIPQGEEYFLMIPNSNSTGYMFVNANNQTLAQLAVMWKSSFAITDNIIVNIKGEPKISGNTMTADFIVSGAREPSVGYAHAIEGGHGWTIVMILLSPTNKYNEFKSNFDELVKSSSVEAPSITTMHGDWNWAEYLKSKYLMSYMSRAGYTERNEIWLCPDGTFRSNIRSKGALKVESSDYRGRKKGTWIAEGIGEKGTLKLTLQKKPSVTIALEIKDDQILLNGGRFFALEHRNCK